MRDFWRALKFAWPYKARLAVSLVCALLVAVLWGTNISAVYPLLTVLLENKTLVKWVENSKSHHERKISELQAEIRELDAQIANAPADTSLTARRGRRLNDVDRRQKKIAIYDWLHPILVRYAPNDGFQTLCLIMLVLAVGMILKCCFDFLQVYYAGSVVQLACFDIRNRFFRRTMCLDLACFTDKGTHELMARFTNDVESLNSGMRALLGKVLLEPLKAGSCLFCCFYFIGWRLTLIALVVFPIAAVAMGLIGRYLKRVSRRNLESMSRIYKILHESFLGIRVVKAFTMERYERRRFFTETKRYYQQAMKLIRTDALSGPILELLAIAAMAGALLFGSYMVMTGATEIWGIRLTHDPLDQSKLFTFYLYIVGMCDPLRKVFSVWGRVQRAVASSERIFHCMDREPHVRQKAKAPHPPRHHDCITFAKVGFAYKAEPVLSDVSFSVRFGETVAVVGATGCGKTTLINLLPRLYDVDKGSVVIDGWDVRDVALSGLRKQIGIVTQNTILFDDTVFNNITYGTRGVDADKVRSAAKDAFAHEFIEELPDGYDTMIGEMGNCLSGGQRQRIALARAILRDPAILILDEATSSLDVESESLIHRALRRFACGRTTFLVTHRLSALDIADRIIVLRRGKIEAIGTHTELLGKSETYCRLHQVKSFSA